jgi:hypothetical protein
MRIQNRSRYRFRLPLVVRYVNHPLFLLTLLATYTNHDYLDLRLSGSLDWECIYDDYISYHESIRQHPCEIHDRSSTTQLSTTYINTLGTN